MLKGAHVAASAGATGVSLDDRLPEHHIFPAVQVLRVKVRSPCFYARCSSFSPTIPVELVHVLQQVPTWCWVLRLGVTAGQRCHWMSAWMRHDVIPSRSSAVVMRWSWTNPQTPWAESLSSKTTTFPQYSCEQLVRAGLDSSCADW